MALLIALLAPLLFSASNLIDKHLVSDELGKDNIWTLSTIASLIGLPFLIVIYLFNHELILNNSAHDSFYATLAGVILTASFVLYYYALARTHASGVAVYFALIPVFTFLIESVVFEGIVTTHKVIASALVVLGSILFNVTTIKFSEWRRITDFFVLTYMSLCCFLISVSFVIFKLVSNTDIFWANAFFDYSGTILFGLLVLSVSGTTRRKLNIILKDKVHRLRLATTNSVNEFFSLAGIVANRYASLLLPIYVVNSIGRTQTLIVYGLEICWQRYVRHDEKILKSLTGLLPLKVLSIALVLAGLFIIET